MKPSCPKCQAGDCEHLSWQERLNKKRLKTKGWYGCIAPDGWKDIVEKTDEMLARIDPDYEITQVKEKYGTLRYYFTTGVEQEKREIMYALVGYAEFKSAHTCEVCGKWGELRDGGYIRTLCDTCYGVEDEDE